MSTLTNGRARKSLSDQLDRLDQTLDNLANGLQEAVETAVQEAVRRVLAEMLANTDLQAHFQVTRQPAEPCASVAPRRTPSLVRRMIGRLGQWLGKGLCRGGQAVRSALRALGCTVQNIAHSTGRRCREGGLWLTTTATRTVEQVRAGLQTAWQTVRILRSLAGPVLLASAVGAILALASYHASPWLAAGASGVAGFVATLGVQVGWWVRQTLRCP